MVRLHFAQFWVQVHQLPFGSVNVVTTKQLGDFIGSVISYENIVTMGRWRSYMQIWVVIDV